MRIQVDPESGCWLWQGQLNNTGYGQVSFDGKRYLAHRLTYGLFVGKLLAGMEVDHLCRRRECVNPDHLELVEHRENVRRGSGPTAANMVKETCKEGHVFDSKNTYVTSRGCRQCRKCKARRQRERQARLRAST